MQTKLPEREHVYQNHVLDSTYWDAFEPRTDDVIIATSMKSGTTWMQTIVANLGVENDSRKILASRDVVPGCW